MKKKVLILAVYPIRNPQHGGQKRTDAIVREYKRAGMNARFAAVFPGLFYDYYSKADIVVGSEVRKKIMASPYTGDVECGLAIYNDPVVKKKMTRLLKDFKPDIIEIEQVFPYLGLEPLLEELGMNPAIVLSGHNIEYIQKKDILESANYDPGFIKKTVDVIEKAEKHLAKIAVVSSAVSKDDAERLENMGASSVVVAPNGIERIGYDGGQVKYWENKFAKMGVNKIILFVGSAHPPNWLGMEEMIGKGLGFIGRDKRIVFAGSVSELVQAEVKKDMLGVSAATFWQRAFAAGRLSQPRLEGLIQFADTILLPITEGGGSNLKTAEAVISGKKVVATSYAFRGFEELKKLPNIYIADTPEEFRETIVEVMDSPLTERSEGENKLAETVLWHNCLAGMVRAVGGING